MLDEIYDSADGFARALDRAAEKFADEAELLVRKTVIDFAEKVKTETPRDTGRAAAGWLLTTDIPSDYEPPDGSYPIAPVEDPGFAGTGMYWLVNNLEYIEVLEDGHSDQAPTGMVANGMNAFEALLNDQLAGTETLKR